MLRETPHYLRPLKTTRTPKKLAAFYAQPASLRSGDEQTYTWAHGALSMAERKTGAPVEFGTPAHFSEPAELWATLDGFIDVDEEVVCWTFNLPVQLRLSAAFIHLPPIGWHLETVSLEPGAAWAKFASDKKTIVFCDLKAWTPYEWERVKDVALAKRGWRERDLVGTNANMVLAAQKTAVIAEAVKQIIEWIDRDELGPFRPTGSGQSYSCYRRHFLTERILAHNNDEQLRAERISMWAGRTEAWQHGNIKGGPFVELDMRSAYARIASQCDVPAVALGAIHRPSIASLLRQTDRYSFLCRVEVETETPVAPASTGTHTIWPVGNFTTWVWEPELRLLDTYATSVKVLTAYRYRKAPALAGFASMVLGVLDQPPDDLMGVPALVVKHWSRTLVGRFGLRYRSWIPYSRDGDNDLSLVTFINADTETMTDMLCVGHDMLLLGDMAESRDSVPQIPAWIMSECRARLWYAMVDIGLDNVVYVDTDSVIFKTHGDSRRERDIVQRFAPLWLQKGRYARLSIAGPRNLHVDDTRRISGLPAEAVRTGNGKYHAEVFKSIREAMRSGQLDAVESMPRNFKFTARDIRRGHNPDGSTYAFRMGGTQLIESE